jgi:hypothetical protein
MMILDQAAAFIPAAPIEESEEQDEEDTEKCKILTLANTSTIYIGITVEGSNSQTFGRTFD